MSFLLQYQSADDFASYCLQGRTTGKTFDRHNS